METKDIVCMKGTLICSYLHYQEFSLLRSTCTLLMRQLNSQKIFKVLSKPSDRVLTINNLSATKFLLRCFPNKFLDSCQIRPALLFACKDGCLAKARYLMRYCKIFDNVWHNEGWPFPLLKIACENSHLRTAEWVLKHFGIRHFHNFQVFELLVFVHKNKDHKMETMLLKYFEKSMLLLYDYQIANIIASNNEKDFILWALSFIIIDQKQRYARIFRKFCECATEIEKVVFMFPFMNMSVREMHMFANFKRCRSNEVKTWIETQLGQEMNPKKIAKSEKKILQKLQSLKKNFL